MPDRTVRVWKSLEVGLTKYNSVLKERETLVEDVGGLRRQNEELRGLLDQYLRSKVNDDLHIPPTQVIRVVNS